MSGGDVHVLVIQHEDVVPAQMLATWLLEAGARLHVLRPDRGEGVPRRDELGAYDAVVVLGGTMDSWDDDPHPWFPATRSLLCEVDEKVIPTLAVCLGHQLAAQAYGGEVGRNPGGQTAGVLTMGWTDEAYDDPLLGGIARATREPSADTVASTQARAVHHNSDIVTRLPPGATVLAAAPDGSSQAARFAGSVWGVQCHPEADGDLVRAWEEHGPRTPREAVIAEAEASMPLLIATWRPLGSALVALARSSRARQAATHETRS